MDDFRREYINTLKNFHKRTRDQLTILLYHGVTKKNCRGIENYSQKHIRLETFEQHMKFLKKNCTLLTIDDVVYLKNNKKSYPPRAVIVSFDDGFYNNYAVAAPVLYDLKIPAVFYISSGMLGKDIMFWVDILEDCLNLTNRRLITIDMNKKYVFKVSSEQEKIRALTKIKSFIKENFACKDAIIEEVISKTGVSPSVEHSENYKTMSWKELKELDSCYLFTIGGHSLYHDILSSLEGDIMEKNIELSLKLLRENLGKTILHYSYPEGQPEHYNQQVIAALKENGILCCPTAQLGLNDNSVDLFHLRRIMVGFCGIEFPFVDARLM